MCVSLFFKFAHVWGQKTLRQWNLSHPHLFSRWSRRSRAMMFRCTVVFFWKYGAPFRVLSLKIYCSPRHAAIKLVYPKFSRTNSYPIVLYNYIPINSLICSYLHYICIYIYPLLYQNVPTSYVPHVHTQNLQFFCQTLGTPFVQTKMFIWPLHPNNIPSIQMLHRPQKPWVKR